MYVIGYLLAIHLVVCLSVLPVALGLVYLGLWLDGWAK